MLYNKKYPPIQIHHNLSNIVNIVRRLGRRIVDQSTTQLKAFKLIVLIVAVQKRANIPWPLSSINNAQFSVM